jgi:hypothetical protein
MGDTNEEAALTEEELALKELATLKLDPGMLEELNKIVEDAQIAATSEQQGDDVQGEGLETDEKLSSSLTLGDSVSRGGPSIDDVLTVASMSSSTSLSKPKMAESQGLTHIDAGVDETLVGCIEMVVGEDGSLEPASFSVDRKGDVITRNVNSMLDRNRRWIVNGRDLGKIVPAPAPAPAAADEGLNQEEWQNARVSRFLEDLNTHRQKIAALYISGLKFSHYNSERISRAVWEDTGIKREGKFKFLVDVDLAFLRHSDFSIDSLYKVLSPAVSGYCALKRIVLTQCRLGLNGVRTVVNATHNNIFVEELIISGNNCTDAVMPDIVQALKGSANRYHLLGMGSNGFSAESMKSFADAVRDHAYLKAIHLSGNPIGDEGAGYVFCYTIVLPIYLVLRCRCLSIIHLLLPTCII